MAYVGQALVPGLALAAAAATIYTSGAGTLVKSAVFANTSALPVVVTLQVKRGASAALTIIPGLSVPANGTYVARELAGLELAAGDTLLAFAATAAVVNFFASGFTH